MASLMVGLALVAATAELPAATCLTTSGQSEMACKPGCCADKACCETTPNPTEPTTQPLARSGHNQPRVNALPSVLVVAPVIQTPTGLHVSSSTECSAHSPPLLELICIRLI